MRDRGKAPASRPRSGRKSSCWRSRRPLAIVAWGYLVYLAIDFGTSARGGESRAWWFLGLSSLGAVLCLFLGLVLVARLLRALGITAPPGDDARSRRPRAPPVGDGPRDSPDAGPMSEPWSAAPPASTSESRGSGRVVGRVAGRVRGVARLRPAARPQVPRRTALIGVGRDPAGGGRRRPRLDPVAGPVGRPGPAPRAAADRCRRRRRWPGRGRPTGRPRPCTPSARPRWSSTASTP